MCVSGARGRGSGARELARRMLAVMHGSSYNGAGDVLLDGLAEVIRESFDGE